jgi:hypothetical protein
MKALFSLGAVVATPGAVDLLEDQGLVPMSFIHRHAQGDWGNLDAHDVAVNKQALKDDGRLMSAYETPKGKLWIITEADRSATTLLLPSEY